MKRTRAMNKAYKGCLKDLDNWLGEPDAGLLIAIICKCLRKLTDNATQNRELRTIEVKVNDYFSAKWNFEKGGFENE